MYIHVRYTYVRTHIVNYICMHIKLNNIVTMCVEYVCIYQCQNETGNNSMISLLPGASLLFTT